MKHQTLLYGMLLALSLSNAVAQSEPKVEKPNIIFIIADDLGWKDLGCYGGEFYRTPHIDQLAREGVQFEQAYAGAANCAPSRASLLSGQYTPRHGIYTVGNSDRGQAADRQLVPIENKTVLADSVYTIAEMLRDKGYYTAAIGKWHLGESPKTQGFLYSIGGNHKGANKHFVPYKNKAIPDGPEGEYLTDRMASEAISFLEKQYKEHPFFLYLSFFAVHTPLQAPNSLLKKYQQEKGTGTKDYPVYAAMIESMDWNVGRVMAKLKELGLEENTIVIFTSDNGGINAISPQKPLRAGKGSYYEGGIRVPLIVRWPGQVKAQQKLETPVSHLDLYPTITELLATKVKQPLDGKSLLPLFDGKLDLNRPLFWHFPIYLQAYDPVKDDGRDSLFRTRPGSAMRYGKWKLHHYDEDDAYLLYNLEEDLGERRNVIQQHPEVAREMVRRLKEWQRDIHAPMPTEINPLFGKKKW